ncbi:MAG: hypothetical protein CBD29_03810 [Synechococcus sp. TMED169]|jgi:hypothetical protein|nr:MAG: hypothetical protein CBD29_03810 [Synechococcus sp. TMED169]
MNHRSAQIKPGDVVAVKPPHQDPFLGQVLYVDERNSPGDSCFAQVIREEDLAIISINVEWVLERVPGTGQRVTC